MTRPQLRLTDADVTVGVDALRSWASRHCGDARLIENCAAVVTLIVAAINEHRGGDPLGTVRQASTGTYAIRVRETGGIYCWRLVHPNGDVDVTDADLSPETWRQVPGPAPTRAPKSGE